MKMKNKNLFLRILIVLVFPKIEVCCHLSLKCNILIKSISINAKTTKIRKSLNERIIKNKIIFININNKLYYKNK